MPMIRDKTLGMFVRDTLQKDMHLPLKVRTCVYAVTVISSRKRASVFLCTCDSSFFDLAWLVAPYFISCISPSLMYTFLGYFPVSASLGRISRCSLVDAQLRGGCLVAFCISFSVIRRGVTVDSGKRFGHWAYFYVPVELDVLVSFSESVDFRAPFPFEV